MKILLITLFLIAFYKFADGLCKEIQDQIL
jgi:hypothetical protein